MTERPWMTALEMQLAAQRIRERGIGDRETGLNRRDRAAFAEAETYAWTSDTTKAVAIGSKSIPGVATVGSALPPGNGAGWWWFDAPVHIAKGTVSISALLYIVEVGHTVWLRSFVAFDAEQSSLKMTPEQRVNAGPIGSWLSWSIGVDETIDVFKDRALTQIRAGSDSVAAYAAMTRLFIGGCAWLKQKIVTVSSGHIERHRRKQLARENNAPLPSEVKVIQLRRRESQSHQRSSDGESVDWSCRWIVNGHWRNQPYKDERKLIYIMPYVKGPEDRPLRVPTHTVYAVNR